MMEFKGKDWEEVKVMLKDADFDYEEEIASPEDKAMYDADDCLMVHDFGESGIALWFSHGVCYEIERLGWV